MANSEADLLEGATAVGINMDETGAYLFADAGWTWTGTCGDGTGDTRGACSAWADGTSGDSGFFGIGSHARSVSWTYAGDVACDTLLHLHCFSNAVVVFWDGFELTGDTSRWSSAVR